MALPGRSGRNIDICKKQMIIKKYGDYIWSVEYKETNLTNSFLWDKYMNMYVILV